MKLPDATALLLATALAVAKTYHRNILGCLNAMCPQAHLAGRSWGLWIRVAEDIKQLWNELELNQL